MKVTKELAKEFLETVPVEVHTLDDGRPISVGVKWGYCREADERFGRTTVMALLDTFEMEDDYWELIEELFKVNQ